MRQFSTEQLAINPGDVLKQLQAGDANWVNFVPPAAAAVIERDKLFGMGSVKGQSVSYAAHLRPRRFTGRARGTAPSSLPCRRAPSSTITTRCPGREDVLIERIGAAEVVLNIRSSSRFTARVFAACPALAAGLRMGHRHRPRRSRQRGAARRGTSPTRPESARARSPSTRLRCCSQWRAAFRKWTLRRGGNHGPAEAPSNFTARRAA